MRSEVEVAEVGLATVAPGGGGRLLVNMKPIFQLPLLKRLLKPALASTLQNTLPTRYSSNFTYFPDTVPESQGRSAYGCKF